MRHLSKETKIGFALMALGVILKAFVTNEYLQLISLPLGFLMLAAIAVIIKKLLEPSAKQQELDEEIKWALSPDAFDGKRVNRYLLDECWMWDTDIEEKAKIHNMKYFLDTEFHEGFRNPLFGRMRHFIDLISLGLVDTEGRTFYAVCREFDIKAAWNSYQLEKASGFQRNHGEYIKVYWLRENVLRKIWDEHYIDVFGARMPKFTYSAFKHLINKVGKTKAQIKVDLIRYIFPSKEDCQDLQFAEYMEKYTFPQFHAYFAAYDWIAFVTLFGKMIELPPTMPMFINDLKQMLDERVCPKEIARVGYKNAVRNFQKHPNYPKKMNEHHALDDAKWDMELYQFLLKFTPHKQ